MELYLSDLLGAWNYHNYYDYQVHGIIMIIIIIIGWRYVYTPFYCIDTLHHTDQTGKH